MWSMPRSNPNIIQGAEFEGSYAIGTDAMTSSSLFGRAPQLSVRISKAAVNAIIKGAIAIYAIVAV